MSQDMKKRMKVAFRKYRYGSDDYLADGLVKEGFILPPCKIHQNVYVVRRDTRDIRYSKGTYAPSKEDNSIYKGIQSIKYMNAKIADEIYELGKNKYDTFVDLLYDISSKTSTDARQLKILIDLDFFSEFGDANTLMAQYKFFDTFSTRKMFDEQ